MKYKIRYNLVIEMIKLSFIVLMAKTQTAAITIGLIISLLSGIYFISRRQVEKLVFLFCRQNKSSTSIKSSKKTVVKIHADNLQKCHVLRNGKYVTRIVTQKVIINR